MSQRMNFCTRVYYIFETCISAHNETYWDLWTYITLFKISLFETRKETNQDVWNSHWIPCSERIFTFFCAHVTWWQHFTTLAIHIFLSLSFSMQNPQFLLLVSLKSPLNWPKIENGLLLQNNQIAQWRNFVTGIKRFTWNDLIFVIVLIWYLPIVNLLSSLPVLTCSRKFLCKWFKFCYCVLYGTNVTYLTPQNKFLDNLRYQKLNIFLTPRQPWCW